MSSWASAELVDQAQEALEVQSSERRLDLQSIM